MLAYTKNTVVTRQKDSHCPFAVTRTITAKPCISSMRSIVYHQHEVLYIIKPQVDARWRVMRYKGGEPPLMICTALRAVMICQAEGLSPAAWINKKGTFGRQKFLFVGGDGGIRTHDPYVANVMLSQLSYTPIFVP